VKDLYRDAVSVVQNADKVTVPFLKAHARAGIIALLLDMEGQRISLKIIPEEPGAYPYLKSGKTAKRLLGGRP
jgi:hypothetical protein